MIKCFFVFMVLFAMPLMAQDYNLTSNSMNGIYSQAELAILQQLSARHHQLLEKEKQLNEKEERLMLLEKKLSEKSEQQPFLDEAKHKAKFYVQLPISKAVALLNELTVLEAKDILNAMPVSISTRLLDQMSFERAQAILKIM